MSKNDIIINSVIAGLQMFKVPPHHLVNESNLPPHPETNNEVKVPPKTPQNGGKVPPPSRAPYKNIYILNDNNNIDIFNEGLRGAWEDFCQFRKEQKKPIKPTQMKHLWNRFNKIIDANGVDGLIASIQQTIERGYQGVFQADGNEIKKVKSNDHTEEDF